MKPTVAGEAWTTRRRRTAKIDIFRCSIHALVAIKSTIQLDCNMQYRPIPVQNQCMQRLAGSTDHPVTLYRFHVCQGELWNVQPTPEAPVGVILYLNRNSSFCLVRAIGAEKRLISASSDRSMFLDLVPNAAHRVGLSNPYISRRALHASPAIDRGYIGRSRPGAAAAAVY